jgi:hypothetical protein
MQINGVAHTFITAGNFTTARAFYGQLLPFKLISRGLDECPLLGEERTS